MRVAILYSAASRFSHHRIVRVIPPIDPVKGVSRKSLMPDARFGRLEKRNTLDSTLLRTSQGD